MSTPACSHQSRPGPTARMIPCCGGGSFVPGGTTRPERRTRSGSSSFTTTWSKRGRSRWRTLSSGSRLERVLTRLRIGAGAGATDRLLASAPAGELAARAAREGAAPGKERRAVAAIKAIFDIRRRSGRAKRALPVAGVPLLLAMVAAPPAGARVPSGFYGVVPYTPLTHRDFKRMGDARVGSLRQQFYWPAIQPTRRGPLNWGGIDATVAEAASQHIAILPTLAGTPPYEAGGCTRHGR